MKTAQELSALRQEVKDFKEEIIPRIRDINEHTKKTNGNVTKLMKEQALLEQKQENCPARKYYNSPTRVQEKDWSIKKGSIVAMIVVAILTISAQLAIAYIQNKGGG